MLPQSPVKSQNPPSAPAAIALFLAVFCLFLPCLRNGFINLDDPVYLLSNAHIQHGFGWQTVQWAFTTGYAANWHPLTWLSHALDWRLFGDRAWGHHLVNAALHACSAAALFIALRKMTGAFWRSLFVAAVFGVHPLRVESVAWAAERKDVLSTLFWMLTIWAYVAWVQKSAGMQRGGRAFYALALGFFALGLLAKSMLVTLPFTLLLLDCWPLGRWPRGEKMTRLVIEKIPFFLLTFADCVATYRAQQAGGAITIGALHLGLGARIANACVSYVRYLGKLFVPVDLAVFYPLPQKGRWPAGMVVASATLLLVLTAVAVMRARRQPYFFTGWFWYLGTLLPVIGLVQVGSQAMADRYTYVPLIGVTIALTWGVCDAAALLHSPKFALPAVAGIALAACAFLTERQIGWWRDSETVFRHALAVTPDNPITRLGLGTALATSHRTDDAIAQFQRALELAPESPGVNFNFGMALFDKGDFRGAASHFQEALAATPNDDQVHFFLGLALQGMGEWNLAAEQFKETTALKPDFDDAHFHFGLMLRNLGFIDEAIVQYQAALRLNPRHIDARNNLGVAYCSQKRWDDAIREFQEALKQNPALPETRNNLGLAYENEGRWDDAIAQYREALRLKPDFAQARENLDAVLENQPGKPPAPR